MSRIGRRFVPQSTIDRRVQAKDDRIAAELRRRQRHPLDEPVVEIALIPLGNNQVTGPVIDMAIVPVDKQSGQIEEMLISEDPPTARFPKPSRVARATLQTDARTRDRHQLVKWAVAVKLRDGYRDRYTGARLRRTMNLDPDRAEAHHIVPREVRAVRYDVRNGITLSLAHHEAVERGELKIEGTAWFEIDGVTYIDATFPVRFVPT